MYKPVFATKGQILSFGEAKEGMRTYLAYRRRLGYAENSGQLLHVYAGGFGGHGGRALRTGDVLGVNKKARSQC